MAATVAAVALLASAGCRQGAQGFGETPRAARDHADSFLASITHRFTNVHRTPRFAAARGRLGRYALTPSKIVGDTSIWTSVERDSTRVVNIAGWFDGARYVFHATPAWDIPDPVGHSRHQLRLRPLGDGEFEWTTHVDQSVGSMPASGVSDAFGAMFRAIEALPAATLRADTRAVFPRTTAALGRLFTVDSLTAVNHAQGGRRVALVVTLHPDRLEEAGFPAFARYLRKYVGPSRYRWTLRDATGATWFVAHADDDRLRVDVRVHDGALQPLDGPLRPMPADLALDGEMFVKVMIFEVGATDIRAKVRRVRTASEDAWRLTFDREPEWKLPLATRQILRAPLRRPFEQGGSTMSVGFRDRGAATHLSRTSRIVVQESAILRWLGALGWTAMSDFSGPSEIEENRFNAEAFAAMRADSREVLGALLAGQ